MNMRCEIDLLWFGAGKVNFLYLYLMIILVIDVVYLFENLQNITP